MRATNLSFTRTAGLDQHIAQLLQSSSEALEASRASFEAVSVRFMQALLTGCGLGKGTPVLRLIHGAKGRPSSVSYHDGRVNVLLFQDEGASCGRILYRGVQGEQNWLGTGNHVQDVSALTSLAARQELQTKIQRLARGEQLPGARVPRIPRGLRCIAAVAQLPHLQVVP